MVVQRKVDARTVFDNVATRERMQGDVVDEMSFKLEVLHQTVLSQKNAMMTSRAVPGQSLGVEQHPVDRTEIASQIDATIAVRYLDIPDPAIGDLIHCNPVHAPFGEVASVRFSGKLDGKIFDPHFADRRLIGLENG